MPAHQTYCSRCQRTHWAFQAGNPKYCVGKKEAPPVQWGKSMEGAQLFGDRVDSFELLGGQNLVLRKVDGDKS